MNIYQIDIGHNRKELKKGNRGVSPFCSLFVT